MTAAGGVWAFRGSQVVGGEPVQAVEGRSKPETRAGLKTSRKALGMTEGLRARDSAGSVPSG
jgi:hypothetical protein